jgi:hypothetical protein
MSSKLIEKIFVGVVIFLLPVFVFHFIYKFGITIPYIDQWGLIPHLEKLHNHTYTLADLWSQHNVHMIIFPGIFRPLSELDRCLKTNY